jgi:undecaprenyl-diphosphatase
MNNLIRYDIELFFKINRQWHNSFLDWLLPLLRNQFFWSPLYLFTLVFILINFKKKGFGWIAFFLITFAITDMLSSSVIKPWVGRLRPCADPFLADSVRQVVGCGGPYSFTSSHAANHFGMAMFAFKTLLFIPLAWRWILFAWAFAISYAQVYVGVHFPLDIACGALLGCAIGMGTAWTFNKKAGLSTLA